MIERLFYVLVLTLCSAPLAWAVPGAGEVSKGNAAYVKGDFTGAIGHYEAAAAKAPNDPRIDYDLGAAAYKAGKYVDAVGFLNKALLADTEKLQDDAQYNLANALYKAGVEKEEKDLKGAIDNVEESLVHYEKVLAANSKNDDATTNRVFVAAELERLKKKRQEQQNKNQQDQQQPKDQPSKDQSQQQKDQSQPSKDQGQQSKDQAQPSKDQGQQPQDQAQPSKDQQEQGKGQEEQKSGVKKAGEKQESSSPGQSEQGHILSRDEADMLLDDFDQNEQPKGMLNFMREPHQERPVTKDW